MSLAGRPSMRRDHIRGWALVPNPDFPAEHGQMNPSCHDGSTFITIECSCGEQMHLHETQIEGLRPDDEVATRCINAECGRLLMLGGKFVLAGFEAVK